MQDVNKIKVEDFYNNYTFDCSPIWKLLMIDIDVEKNP